LIGPSTLLADDGDETGTSLQNGIAENSTQGQTDSESEGLLEEILDALLGLVGANTNDDEGPLQNVHPPDYNPPTPEKDDIGWDDPEI
jgi:hypothetical protein